MNNENLTRARFLARRSYTIGFFVGCIGYAAMRIVLVTAAQGALSVVLIIIAVGTGLAGLRMLHDMWLDRKLDGQSDKPR